jgi:putative FmdB family regulatory protein
MPTYEFRCPQGHEFEKLYRTISGAEAQALCPQCGQPAERVMSATGFAFKGSGFYLTDYGKNAHRDKGTPEPKTGAPAGEGGGGGGGAEGGSDSARSESKSDSAPAGGASSAPAAEAKKSENKSETKKSEPKAEPKPAAAPAKKSSGE